VRIDLPNEIKAARIWLSDWGKWHKRTHSLPPHARLATPGADIIGSEEAVETTHAAVMALQAHSYHYYLIIKDLYENHHDSVSDVFNRLKGRLGLESISGFYKARNRAETKLFHLRVAEMDRAEDQYLGYDKKNGTTC